MRRRFVGARPHFVRRHRCSLHSRTGTSRWSRWKDAACSRRYPTGTLSSAGPYASRSDLRRGDIVVFRSELSEELTIKRLWGLPGDTLAAVGMGNGVVPDGLCVVLSDNPSVRGDSRLFGPIPLDWIIARTVSRRAAVHGTRSQLHGGPP